HFARALPILSPAPTLEAVSQPSVWQSVMSGGCCKLITGRPTAPFQKEETVSLRWLGSNTRASALPTPHTLVRAAYIGRACIAVTAVLMPPRSAALITTLVGLVYIADVFFGHSTPLTPDVAIQLAVFVTVAAVTAYVASRVKLMGAEREALAGELRQARLEA